MLLRRRSHVRIVLGRPIRILKIGMLIARARDSSGRIRYRGLLCGVGLTRQWKGWGSYYSRLIVVHNNSLHNKFAMLRHAARLDFKIDHSVRATLCLNLCFNQKMKRFLIGLFLVFVSIQTSFATISSYCEKEVISASHIAHHEHNDSSKSAVNDSSNSNDSDCTICHLAHSPALGYFLMPILSLTGAQFDGTPAELFITISHKPPEKPNWFDLA